MARILVTGATGLLGSTLVPFLVRKGHSVIRHGHRIHADINANLCNPTETSRLLTQASPDCIINLAALTNVDTCEAEPDKAYQLNVSSVHNICQAIRQHSSVCHLVHISTDQLYDGQGPHREHEITIRNCYAFSKIAAEFAAVSVPSTIIRTNFFGRSQCSGRSSFSDWLYQGLKHNEPLSVFEDVLFSPLSTSTLCTMIERLVLLRPVGVFNLGSCCGMSKADYAYAFAAALDFSTHNLKRTLSSSMPLLNARRPKDMRMDSQLFEQTLGVILPSLTDEINNLRSDYIETT